MMSVAEHWPCRMSGRFSQTVVDEHRQRARFRILCVYLALRLPLLPLCLAGFCVPAANRAVMPFEAVAVGEELQGLRDPRHVLVLDPRLLLQLGQCGRSGAAAFEHPRELMGQ